MIKNKYAIPAWLFVLVGFVMLFQNMNVPGLLMFSQALTFFVLSILENIKGDYHE